MDYAASIRDRLPGVRKSTGFKQLLTKLDYLPNSHRDVIVAAYEFGANAHDGQKRLSGEPYISHPVAVASILADLHLDSQSIAAAILHDVLEDTTIDILKIEEKFGSEIATLVDGVSKLDQLNFYSRSEAQVESITSPELI